MPTSFHRGRTCAGAALLIALVTALGTQGAAAQEPDTAIVAGPEYAKGWLYRFYFGSDYRDLWTEPVRAPVLDLATFAGGLAPTTAGGGFQTKSLRFRGADGFEYGFRSVDKDMDVLPPEWEGSVVESIVQDQTSSAHPGAPPVVLLTFHESETARVEAWAAGADGFVPKTKVTEELMRVIRNLLPEPARGSSEKSETTLSKKPGKPRDLTP